MAIESGSNTHVETFGEHNDNVNHPTHYTSADNGVECIDAIFAALGNYPKPVDAWLAGQIIKYLWRAPLKGKYKEDIQKANFYMKKLIDICERSNDV